MIDWSALLMPPRRRLTLVEARQQEAVEQLEAELTEDLAGLPHLRVWSGPHLDLLVPRAEQDLARRALSQTFEPRGSRLVHLSGLALAIQEQLPGGPPFQEIWRRSLAGLGEDRRPDSADALWVKALRATLSGWSWIDFSEQALLELRQREAGVARPALLAWCRAHRVELPAEVRTWLEEPPVRLAQQLIVHGLVERLGWPATRGLLGWRPGLELWLAPSRGYRDWLKASPRHSRSASRL